MPSYPNKKHASIGRGKNLLEAVTCPSSTLAPVVQHEQPLWDSMGDEESLKSSTPKGFGLLGSPSVAIKI